jgi:hypothetical protein
VVKQLAVIAVASAMILLANSPALAGETLSARSLGSAAAVTISPLPTSKPTSGLDPWGGFEQTVAGDQQDESSSLARYLKHTVPLPTMKASSGLDPWGGFEFTRVGEGQDGSGLMDVYLKPDLPLPTTKASSGLDPWGGF